MSKKILFILLFVCGSFFPVQKTLAITSAECTALGGVCNTVSSSCAPTEDSVGVCTTGINSACCKPKASTGINSGSNYIPLENIPFINGTSFQTYVEGLYTLGLVLVVLSAVFMLVIGGFMYLTSAGNTSAISSAKHVIQGAIFGLILALVSFLILNIINSDLTNVNVSTFQPLAIRSSGGGGTGGGGGGTGGGGTGYFEAKQSSNVYTDAEARAALTAAGITVNKGNCSTPSQTNCTSLDQIPKSIINTAIALKRDCGCRLVVTGGTEAGHSTHGKNRAALDISRNPSGVISRQPILIQSGGRPVYSYNGVRIWDEDNAHYHMWEPAN